MIDHGPKRKRKMPESQVIQNEEAKCMIWHVKKEKTDHGSFNVTSTATFPSHHNLSLRDPKMWTAAWFRNDSVCDHAVPYTGVFRTHWHCVGLGLVLEFECCCHVSTINETNIGPHTMPSSRWRMWALDTQSRTTARLPLLDNMVARWRNDLPDDDNREKTSQPTARARH